MQRMAREPRSTHSALKFMICDCVLTVCDDDYMS